MAVLRESRPPPAVQVREWILVDYTDLQSMRADLRHVLDPQHVSSRVEFDEVAERVAVVATELATNALRHTRSPAVVFLNRTRRTFVIDVVDDCPQAVPAVVDQRLLTAGGRGLQLTTALASDAGWYADEYAKHVWAQISMTRRRRVVQAPRIAVPALDALLRSLRRISG